MTWSLIANITSTTGGSATSPSKDTTNADLIVIWVDDDGPNQGVSAPRVPTDNKGNSYTLHSTLFNDGTDVSAAVYYFQNPAVGSGHTWTSGHADSDICVSAWSGSASSPFDQQNFNSDHAGVSPPLTTGSITPSQDGELVITGLAGTMQTSITYPSGYTGMDKVLYGATGRLGRAHAYQIQSTATATNPSWTWGSNPFSDFCTAVVSFKAAAAIAAADIAQGCFALP